MTGKRQNRMHYAWLILIGCCALQGASLGLIHNCAGLFYAPVCQELGFETGEFSAYRMLYSISSALTLPLVAKCLRRFPVRLVISAAAVVFGLCTAAMGMFHELYEWYAAGVIQGIASSFLCFLPAPILLGNWFQKKCGTAIGISAAFSGFVGMLGSSGLGFAIPAFGWRACYGAAGAICILLILPFSLFVFRYRPEELGLKPYGSQGEEGKRDADRAGEAPSGLRDFLRQPVFYAALAAYAASTASGYLNTFLTPCGLAAGLTMTMAAMLTTLSLLGNMGSKLLLGRASDSWGTIRTFLAAAAISCAGHFLLLTGNSQGVLAGAFVYGITLPVSSVMLPLFCRLYWKGDAYGTAFSYISMAGMLIASPFNSLFGQFYDRTGSYNLTILTSCGLMAATMALVWMSGKRKEA